MAVRCRNKSELAEAIKKDAKDIVIIDADLKRHVLRISATGKIAWAVAIGAIGVAIVTAVMAPGPGTVAGPMAMSLTAATVTPLGIGTTQFAIAMAMTAGSVGVLNKLRKYTITKNKNGSIRLTK